MSYLSTAVLCCPQRKFCSWLCSIRSKSTSAAAPKTEACATALQVAVATQQAAQAARALQPRHEEASAEPSTSGAADGAGAAPAGPSLFRKRNRGGAGAEPASSPAVEVAPEASHEPTAAPAGASPSNAAAAAASSEAPGTEAVLEPAPQAQAEGTWIGPQMPPHLLVAEGLAGDLLRGGGEVPSSTDAGHAAPFAAELPVADAMPGPVDGPVPAAKKARVIISRHMLSHLDDDDE